MEYAKKKLPLVTVGLCLLAGLLFFFRSTPKISSASRLESAQKSQAAIGADSYVTTVQAETEKNARPHPLPTAEIASAPILPDSEIARTAVVIDLPEAPSGDYEINLTLEQISAMVETKYEKFFRALGLPPGQLVRLRALLVERQQATIDAANAALQNGLNPIRDLPTIRSAIEQAQATVDATLRSELGEPVLAAYRNFDGTLKARNFVGDFTRLLSQTAEPLRPEQENQLMQILQNSTIAEPSADFGRTIFGDINTRPQIGDQAKAATAAVLSAQQQNLFLRLQRHWAEKDADR